MLTETTEQRRKAYSVKSAAAQIDVSMPFVRKEIRSGNLKAKKVGTRILILDSELDNYLASKSDWKPTNENGENN